MINPAHNTSGNGVLPSSPALRTSRKGFTLIELLVVIAIIAILAAILFPAFARARENARRASCQSNLKQIALGVFQYTQDYDERFPMRYWGPGAAYYTTGWAAAVQPYVKSTQLFQCPSEPTAPSAFTSDYAIDYGYNASLGNVDTSISLAAVNFPSVTVLNYDYKSASVEAGYFDISIDPASTKRHLEGANYSFTDGHVKWYRPEKVLSANNGSAYDAAGKCASTGASYAGNGNPTFCY